MLKKKRIAVIIPAYNEEKFISDVIGGIPRFVDYIIVVDDASQDGTSKRAKETGDDRLVLLRNKQNEGVGGAMVRGYQTALDLKNDIAVKIDADNQMPLDKLESLIGPIIDEGYSYTKGNRFLEESPQGHMPRHRFIGNILLSFLTKLASGYWHVFDPQNGFTAIEAKALRALDLTRLNKGYFFENDMLVELNIHKFRVKDVAMPVVYHEEESNINLVTVFITFPILLTNRFFRRVYQKYVLRDFSPIAFLLIFGFLLMSWGVGFGLYHWAKSIATGVTASTGTVMLSVLPLILGFQLILQAVVLDIDESPR